MSACPHAPPAPGDALALLLPVLRHDKAKAWPKADDDTSPAAPEPIRYVEAAEAFTTTYATDAHFAAYSVPEAPYRLRLDALTRPELAAGWRMVLLVTDVDHPWHRVKPTTDEGRAALAEQVREWWAVEAVKLDALAAVHPGVFVYRSRSGGYRIVYRLPVPVVIRTEADREAWRVRYQRELLYLARQFGIVGDPACADLTRLYRLPCVTRKPGEPPTAPEMRGDPAALGAWTHEPSADELGADLAAARTLAAEAPTTWNSVVQRLQPPKHRGPRPPRASGPRPRPANDGPSDSSARPDGRPPQDDDELARMVAYARAALAAVIEEIAATPGHITGGNNALNAGVYKLARYVPHLLNECEIRTLALDAAHRCGVIARDGAGGERHALGTIDSAMRAGRRSPRWPVLDSDEADEGPTSGPLPALLSAAEAGVRMAAALLSPTRLVVIRSTPGAGKSAAVRLQIRDHIEADGCALVFVPTHALAAQTVEGLEALGVRATAPVGAARVRLPVLPSSSTEARACIHADAAELLAASGIPARGTLCTVCPAKDSHPTTGGPCPAYAAGTTAAPVQVQQHTVVSAVLAEHTARLRDGKDTAATLAVIDEHLPPTTTTETKGALGAYAKEIGALQEDVREQIEPLLLAVLRGADKGADRATLRDLAKLGGLDSHCIDSALEAARGADSAQIWRRGLHTDLAHFVVKYGSGPDSLDRLRRVARVTALCEAIVDAAHTPDRPALWVDEQGAARLVTPARWARRVAAYVEAGGRVRYLDATASETALRAFWGEAFDFVRLDVADAPGVARRRVLWPHGAKGRHCAADAPIADELRGPLRRLAQIALEHGARSAAIFAHRPVAEALRAWLAAPRGGPPPAFVPDELAALVAAGVELRVGHYGAQRGLDTWADCDVIATTGDAWPNLGAARAEALALGIAPDGWAREQAEAELIQAWGRARTVHRTTPVLVLHQGAKALQPRPEVAPQWAEVEAEQAPRGRPSKPPPSDPATWPEERGRLELSARDHAAYLGIPWATYCRLTKATEQETLQNKWSEVAHNPATDVLSGVDTAPARPSSSIPDYGPREPTGFEPDRPIASPAIRPPPGVVASPAFTRRPSPAPEVLVAPDAAAEGAMVA